MFERDMLELNIKDWRVLPNKVRDYHRSESSKQVLFLVSS